ncbi:hypothetical protein ACHQM5_006081 [Ranunculus cassubicifolius]
MESSVSSPLIPSISTTSPKKHSSILLFISLLVTCTSLVVSVVFASLFFTTLHNTPQTASASLKSDEPLLARPLRKLKRPVVLLISADGFRFGYQHKTSTPNIRRLIANGTEAETGLIPVFPTLTFPNHYSIVTGLYPVSHGIVNNYFVDPTDGSAFTTRSLEPRWWLGEPLWQTVVKHGLKAATYFWAGSEVNKNSWECPPKFCAAYNYSTPFDDRVDTVLSYFDLPSKEIPSFITLYFEDPDSQGHTVGPDDPTITDAIANIDRLIGRLISGLEQRGIFEDVTMIMVGDHGMVGTCDKKLIFLDDLAPWVTIPVSWVQYYTPLLSIRPPAVVSSAEVVAKMNQGLASGQVQNGNRLKVYLNEDLPKRLHYTGNARITPIIGLVDEGFKVEQRDTKQQQCGGAHGYDNAFFSMRTIFIAHGPQFARGRKVPSFENVQIYNVITSILKIQGAQNNGTASFARSLLLPTK